MSYLIEDVEVVLLSYLSLDEQDAYLHGTRRPRHKYKPRQWHIGHHFTVNGFQTTRYVVYACLKAAERMQGTLSVRIENHPLRKEHTPRYEYVSAKFSFVIRMTRCSSSLTKVILTQVPSLPKEFNTLIGEIAAQVEDVIQLFLYVNVPKSYVHSITLYGEESIVKSFFYAQRYYWFHEGPHEYMFLTLCFHRDHGVWYPVSFSN